MNEERNLLDTTQIDFMVDGELNADARRELLLQAEETTGAWRQIALAYVEAQQWKSGISQLLAEPAVPLAVVTKTSARSHFLSMVTRSIAAVALLVSIASISYYLGLSKAEQQLIAQQHENLQPKTITTGNQTGTPLLKLVANSFQPETTILRFEHPETGDITEQEFIVIDPDNPPPQFENWISQYEGELQISSNLLEDVGKRVNQQINDKFYSLTLKDGRQAIIPVNSSLVEQIENNELEFQ